MVIPLSVILFKLVGCIVCAKFLTKGAQEITSIGNHHTTLSSTGKPWILLVYRVCMFLVTFAVQYIQLTYRSLRALRYFTVWNWIAIIVYFFLGSISSIQHQLVPAAGKEEKRHKTTTIVDRLLVSLFHAILPMTLFIDVVTWTILTPMLVNVPDPERALHWRTVMYSPISYMQHGGNAIIMFGEFLLNTIPNSNSWSHGVVALWSILFGIWSLIFFSFTGQAIYPFLDTSKKTGHPVWVAYLGLSLSWGWGPAISFKESFVSSINI